MKITSRELDERFAYHRMDAEQVSASDAIRAQVRTTAETFVDRCPDGRETSLAITKLEEAQFWANKAIARGES